jgi:hypothetical protein
MDSVRWVVERRVICRVEAEAYDLFSTHAPVMFDEKQRFSESVQNWQTQVIG